MAADARRRGCGRWACILLSSAFAFLIVVSQSEYIFTSGVRSSSVSHGHSHEDECEGSDWLSASGRLVVVTGASGYLGARLAQHCHEALSMKVIGVDMREASPAAKGLMQAFVLGDLAEEATWARVLESARGESVAALYHLASDERDDANLAIMKNLVRRFLGPGSSTFVVFTSSIDVYGDNHENTLTDATAPSPTRAKGIALLGLERVLVETQRSSQYTILRLYDVYGPNQLAESSTIGGLVARSLANRTVRAPTQAWLVFPSFVDDVVAGVARASFSRQIRGRAVNFGGQYGMPAWSVAEKVADSLGMPLILDENALGFGHRGLTVSVQQEAASCALGIQAFTSWEKGLRAITAAYETQSAWDAA